MQFAIYVESEEDSENGASDSKETQEEHMIESWQFNFSYPDSESVVVNGKESSKENMRKQAVLLMRSLVEFSKTLDDLPQERFLTIKLYYYDDITPPNYEPPFFRKESSLALKFPQHPHRVKVGALSSSYHTINIKYSGLSIENMLFDEEEEEEEEEERGEEEDQPTQIQQEDQQEDQEEEEDMPPLSLLEACVNYM